MKLSTPRQEQRQKRTLGQLSVGESDSETKHHVESFGERESESESESKHQQLAKAKAKASIMWKLW
jgi:hypothetical protein